MVGIPPFIFFGRAYLQFEKSPVALYIQGVVLRETGGQPEVAADTPGLESDMRDVPTQVVAQTVDIGPSGVLDNGQCEFVVVLDRFPNPAYTPKFEDVFLWKNGDPRMGCMVRGTEIDRFVVLRRVPIEMPPQSTEFPAVSRQGVKTFINIGHNVVSEFRDSMDQLTGGYNNIVKNAIICYFVWECRTKSLVRAHLNCRLRYCY
ncbi:nuclear shuttle protein [Camellia oleifera geminivirus]|nr:nuclear shuttle protein [Camellia oleifera geminivirus]